MEVSVLGNLSRKLASTNIAMNQIPPEILGPAHQSQVDRPFPQFNGVTILAPPLGVSNYYAALVRFEKRYSHGLQHASPLTRGRSSSTTPTTAALRWATKAGPTRITTTGAPTTALGQRHPPPLHLQRGLSAAVRRRARQLLSHKPVPARRRRLEPRTLTNLQTGAPFTVSTQTNNTNAFSAGALRAECHRRSQLPRASTRWRSGSTPRPSCSRRIYQFGNEGVGILRAPGLVNLDFSLHARFPLHRASALQFRGEFFNAINHTNLGLPAHIVRRRGIRRDQLSGGRP